MPLEDAPLEAWPLAPEDEDAPLDATPEVSPPEVPLEDAPLEAWPLAPEDEDAPLDATPEVSPPEVPLEDAPLEAWPLAPEDDAPLDATPEVSPPEVPLEDAPLEAWPLAPEEDAPLDETPLVPAVRAIGADSSAGWYREAPLITNPPTNIAAPTVRRLMTELTRQNPLLACDRGSLVGSPMMDPPVGLCGDAIRVAGGEQSGISLGAVGPSRRLHVRGGQAQMALGYPYPCVSQQSVHHIDRLTH